MVVKRTGVKTKSNLGIQPTLPVCPRRDHAKAKSESTAKKHEVFSVNAKVTIPCVAACY